MKYMSYSIIQGFCFEIVFISKKKKKKLLKNINFDVNKQYKLKLIQIFSTNYFFCFFF